MTLQEFVAPLLLKHEGCKLRVYNDTLGIPTIGVGRNLRDHGISLDEAMYLLENDIKNSIKECQENIPFFLRLTQNQQAVLVDMAFNLGITGLLKFTKFLEALERGNLDTARREMLQSKWAIQVKGRALELSNLLEKV